MPLLGRAPSPLKLGNSLFKGGRILDPFAPPPSPLRRRGPADPAFGFQVPPPGPPDALDRMVAITLESESGGRDHDARGRILTSNKGAVGRMQVRPSTARDPGYGVRPARDDSLDEKARVGRDYLVALMQRYGGDPAKAWAAYNDGPRDLNRLIARHGERWREHLPAETRNYVNKNMGLLLGPERK